MNHESLLYRFNSFLILGFTHLYCWPVAVGLAGCLVRHKERIKAENREIRLKKTKNPEIVLPLLPSLHKTPTDVLTPFAKHNALTLSFREGALEKSSGSGRLWQPTGFSNPHMELQMVNSLRLILIQCKAHTCHVILPQRTQRRLSQE